MGSSPKRSTCPHSPHTAHTHIDVYIHKKRQRSTTHNARHDKTIQRNMRSHIGQRGEKGPFRLALHKHAMPAVGKLEKAYFKMVQPFAFNGLEPIRGCTHVRTNRTGRVSRGGGGVGVPAALGPPGLPPTRVQKESLCHGATTCRTQRRRSDWYQSRPQEP